MAVRKYTPFIFVTIVSCSLGIVICGVALGTDFWFHGEAGNGNNKVSLRYGLFKGTKKTETITPPSFEQHDLKLVCIDGLCMFSCGKTKTYREIDLRNARNSGKWSNRVCIDGIIEGPFPIEKVEDSDFIKFGLWLATIFFLAAAIAFFTIAGLLALYNSFRVPIQPIFSVFGLYIWNGIAAACVLCALVMWGVLFAATLKSNPNVSETLNGDLNQGIKTQLGFSFWILLLAQILPIVNIAVLVVRSWKIAKIDAVNKTIAPTTNTGDVLLF